PSSTSSSVTHMFEMSSALSTFSECQVSSGEASVRLSTPWIDATACQISTKTASSTNADIQRLILERLQRALLEPGEDRVGDGVAAVARARERHVQLLHHAARPRRQHRH